MRTAAKVAVFSLLALLFVIALLVIALVSIDLGRFKDPIEAVASDTLGRELEITGPLHIEIGRTIDISAHGISLDNAQWATDPDIISVASLQLEIDTFSLLTGTVVVNGARFGDIDIDLQQRPDGTANWELWPPGDATDPAREEDTSSTVPVLVKALWVEDTTLTYAGPLLAEPVELSVASIRQQLDAEGLLQLTLEAAVNGTRSTATLLAGPFDQLLAMGAVSFELNAAVGEIAFNGTGSVANLAELSEPDAVLRVSGPSFNYLAQLLNLRVSVPGALDVQGSIKPADNRLSVQLDSTVGDVEARLSGDLADLRSLEGAILSLVVSGDSDTLLRTLEVDLPPAAGPFRIAVSTESPQAEGSPFRLKASFVDALLEAQGILRASSADLSGSRAQLSLRGESVQATLAQLGFNDAPSGAFDLSASVRLTAAALELDTGLAQFGDKALHVTGRAARDGSELQLQLRGDSAGAWLPSIPPELESEFTGRADVRLTSESVLSGELALELDKLQLQVQPQLNLANDSAPVKAGFTARVIGSDFAGDVSLHRGPIPRVALQLRSGRVDLRPWMSESEAESAQTQVQAGAAAKQAEDRVIPDVDFSAIQFPGLQLTLDYSADRIDMPLEAIHDFHLRSTLADDELLLQRVDFRGQGDGLVAASAGLKRLTEGVEAWIRVSGSNISVGLPAQDPDAVALLPRYDLSLAYTGAGTGLRELVSDSNGYLRLSSGPGKVDVSAMRMFTNDFLMELLNTVNPFAQQDPYSNLQCTTVLAVVEDGELVGEPLMVVQSDRLNVFAKARVDLETEEVQADFNTVPTKGLGLGLSNLVHPFVNVSGTLGQPRLGLDSGSAILEGGAALATGGLSILAKGLFERATTNAQPCDTALLAAQAKFDRLEALYGTGQTPGDSP